MSTTATTPRQQPLREPGGRLARVLRFPLTWMLIGLLGVGVVAGLTAQGPGVVPVLGAAVALVVYRVVMRVVAGRRTPELARRGAVSEALSGAAVGLGFVAVAAAVVAALGGYSFSPADDVDLLAVVGPVLAVAVGGAVTEELTFRGFALQALERLLGSWVALALTALMFGLSHLLNPGATVWSTLAIAIEAGGLLGAAFLWRRNLWFAIALHVAWNGAVALLGIPVSGHVAPGLLVADVAGPSLLTGGAFGIEGSVVTVALSVLLTVPMLLLARRRGTLVPARGPRP
ncbi:CPBP family intramembrane glutamic endopeptidase [Isoptericola sp. F-RaC21]|uniref:CPBP family intramembrane glutamic endopeptidase n=1 Tax=Isoptericola sp. F-RaC21 TaxID=3141452 RepID=UPI00315B42D2